MNFLAPVGADVKGFRWLAIVSRNSQALVPAHEPACRKAALLRQTTGSAPRFSHHENTVREKPNFFGRQGQHWAKLCQDTARAMLALQLRRTEKAALQQAEQ